MFKVALVYNLKKPKSKNFPCDYFSEFDSAQTIEGIASSLRMGGHRVSLVEADEGLLDWLRSHRIDIVFNIAEGRNGLSRESQVPALLDSLNIPYTGSGVLTFALSLDKAKAKQIFIQQGIPTPRFQLFKNEVEPLQESLRFPLIIKPNSEGSAKGIHASNLVTNQSRLYEEIVRIKRLYHQDILVEEFIDGVEVTVGILGNGDLQILPPLEIDFTNCKKKGESFYSWEVKEYQGIDPLYPDPEFFCPARLSKAQENEVKKVAQQAHRALDCLDLSRVDIRLDAKSLPYVLEVNPLPGLDSQESNLTRMAKAGGVSYPDLINGILESALKRYGLIDTVKAESVKEAK